GGARPPLPGSEADVAAGGEGARPEPRRGGAVGVDTHAVEIGPEALLELAALAGRKGQTGAEAKRARGGHLARAPLPARAALAGVIGGPFLGRIAQDRDAGALLALPEEGG